MTFLYAFIAALIFWTALWWVAGQVAQKYEIWKHEQYADKHFKQTERFRREFTG
jgi:hypothetical protein